MRTSTGRRAVQSAALLLMFAIAGCQKSDVIAPDGATISLTSNPATIVVSGGVQVSPVTILATVSSSIGVPLPGQDVRFTTTSGFLDPPTGTPVRTDSQGNAFTTLTAATQAPTITAKSGKATASLTMQTATCNLAKITLNPGPLSLTTCSDTFDLTATALDTANAPCAGILIQFSFDPSNPSTTVSGTFNPVQKSTDGSGVVDTTLTISNADCNSKCVGKDCGGSILATSGSVKSSPVLITDTVP